MHYSLAPAASQLGEEGCLVLLIIEKGISESQCCHHGTFQEQNVTESERFQQNLRSVRSLTASLGLSSVLI